MSFSSTHIIPFSNFSLKTKAATETNFSKSMQEFKKQLKSRYLLILVKGQLSFINIATCLDPPLRIGWTF